MKCFEAALPRVVALLTILGTVPQVDAACSPKRDEEAIQQKIEDQENARLARLEPVASREFTKYVLSFNGPGREKYIRARASVSTGSGCQLWVTIENTSTDEWYERHGMTIGQFVQYEQARYPFDKRVDHRWLGWCAAHDASGARVFGEEDGTNSDLFFEGGVPGANGQIGG
jgi:hypothetical protein